MKRAISNKTFSTYKFTMEVFSLFMITFLIGCSEKENTIKPVPSFKTAPVQEKSISKEKKRYNLIKDEYQLVGVWEVSNKTANWRYDYEIFQKGKSFIGIIKSYDELRQEFLQKKGDTLKVLNNKYGEYYILKEGSLMLYDQDGDLSSAGYSATSKNN